MSDLGNGTFKTLLNKIPPNRSNSDTATFGVDQVDTELNVSVSDLQGHLLEIVPHKDNAGIADGVNLLQSLHDVRIEDGDNVSQPHSFEVWYDRGEFHFFLEAATERARDRFQRRVSNVYTDAEVNPVEQGVGFPTIEPGFYRAAGYLNEKRHTFLPIKHHNAEGFETGDPYADILGEMTTLDNSVVVLQVIFKPAHPEWTRKGPDGAKVEHIAEDLRTGDVEDLTQLKAWNPLRELEEHGPSKKDKQAAQIVEEQRGRQGFHANIRVFAASPDRHEAEERVRGTTSMFAKYYNSQTEQGLRAHGIAAEDVPTQYGWMITREWKDRSMILSIDELAGVAHIPNGEIEVPGIQWRHSKTGSEVPSTAPKDETTGSPDKSYSAQSSGSPTGSGQAGDDSPSSDNPSDRSLLSDSHDEPPTADGGQALSPTNEAEPTPEEPGQQDTASSSTITARSMVSRSDDDTYIVDEQQAEQVAANIATTTNLSEFGRKDLDNLIYDEVAITNSDDLSKIEYRAVQATRHKLYEQADDKGEVPVSDRNKPGSNDYTFEEPNAEPNPTEPQPADPPTDSAGSEEADTTADDPPEETPDEPDVIPADHPDAPARVTIDCGGCNGQQREYKHITIDEYQGWGCPECRRTRTEIPVDKLDGEADPTQNDDPEDDPTEPPEEYGMDRVNVTRREELFSEYVRLMIASIPREERYRIGEETTVRQLIELIRELEAEDNLVPFGRGVVENTRPDRLEAEGIVEDGEIQLPDSDGVDDDLSGKPLQYLDVDPAEIDSFGAVTSEGETVNTDTAAGDSPTPAASEADQPERAEQTQQSPTQAGQQVVESPAPTEPTPDAESQPTASRINTQASDSQSNADHPESMSQNPTPDEAATADQSENSTAPITPNDTYAISPVGRETAGTHEVMTYTETEGPVAGHKVRQLIEKKAYDPERPIYLGYDDAARGGFREAGYDFEVFKKHFWVSGTTGAGKTTVLHNKALHHAFGNHGFCNIDPKADGDTIDLLRKIPSARLDDVIFLEPGSSQFDRTIGINILDVPAIEDRDDREKEIENRLENLTAIFDNDDYWGPTMASITESMGRAMLRHNAEVSLDPDRDSSDKYSVIDMYFILLDQERRENFAETVDDPYLRDFLWQIADMKDEEVRPLLKRIKRWVENPIVRRIVAQRESTIDWDRIVDGGKILLVRIPVDSEDVHQMITLTVLRNLWSAKKRQVRDEERPDDQPYFVQVDEFEKVANENLNMDGMLARARSFWLSVALGTQYPGQIKTDHEPILRAMENNCNTLLAMKTPGPKDSRLLMQRFADYDSGDLINTDQHRTWTKIPLADGTESEPLNIKTFAPYPPLRDGDAATAAIIHSLREYGTPPITESEIQNDLKVGNVGELTNPESAGFEELSSSKDSSLSLSMVPDETFLESVFAAQIQYEGVGEPVPQTNVEEALAVRVGDVGFDSEISNRFEKNNQIIVTDQRIDGEVTVKLTEDGLNTVLSHDTGSSASGGGPEHRWVLRQSYKTFTKLGAITQLPTQEGDELPDGVADLPHDPLSEADTVKEANAIRDEMIDNHPRLWELSNGRDIAIEAETSTIKKPMQTLTNLRKAIESGKTCVFACKDAHSDDVDGHDLKYWPTRGEKIIYRSNGGSIDYDTINCVPEVLSSGDRTFYNKTSYLKLDTAHVAVAPRPDTHNELLWREDGEAIVAVSKGGDREELARFGNAELAGDPPAATTMHREKQGDQWVVKTGTGSDAQIEAAFDDLDALEAEYMDLYAPFIPENEFPRPVEDDDFTFMAFPDADNDDHAEPVVVEHGRATKLSELAESDTDGMEINDDPLSVDGDEAAGTSGHSESDDSPQPDDGTDSSQQGSSEPTPSSDSSPDPTVSATETPPSTATINPHELTGQHSDRFDIETLQTWASGAALPHDEQFQQFVDAVDSVNPEAAAYIEAPEDIPAVMGVGTAGSSQPRNSQSETDSVTDGMNFG